MDEVTEAGPPATTAKQFQEEVLKRPLRWLCHLGIQSTAILKRCNVVVWTKENGEWRRVAVIKPDETEKKVPTIGSALQNGHYFALIPGQRRKTLRIGSRLELG